MKQITKPIIEDRVSSGFKYLTILMVLYTSVILMANWFDARLIDIHGLITDSGTLIFPLTYILSDIITEVYGYKHARKCIWIGLIINILFIAYGQLVIRMPSPGTLAVIHTNEEFASLVNTGSRIIIASIISYVVAEPCNSIIMSVLKKKTDGQLMAMRLIFSTVVAAFIDSMVFSVIAFYGTMTFNSLVIFALTMWIFKVVIELCIFAFSKRLAIKLKQAEKTDIYDYGTSYNFFNFDTSYLKSNNKYKAND